MFCHLCDIEDKYSIRKEFINKHLPEKFYMEGDQRIDLRDKIFRKFFTAFGWTDEIGSGIRNTFRYLPYYVPGAKPLFVENDTFKTEIPLVFATLADHAVKLFKWLDLPVLNEEKLQQELINIPLPSSLAGKHWEEIILHLVPSWQLNGTQYPALKWPDKQFFTGKIENWVPSQTKKVPSKKKKGAKLA